MRREHNFKKAPPMEVPLGVAAKTLIAEIISSPEILPTAKAACNISKSGIAKTEKKRSTFVDFLAK